MDPRRNPNAHPAHICTGSTSSTALVATPTPPVTGLSNSWDARSTCAYEGETPEAIYGAAKSRGFPDEVAELFKQQRKLAIYMGIWQDDATVMQVSMHRLQHDAGSLAHIANILTEMRWLGSREGQAYTAKDVAQHLDASTGAAGAADTAASLRRHALVIANDHAGDDELGKEDFETMYPSAGGEGEASWQEVENTFDAFKQRYENALSVYHANHETLRSVLDPEILQGEMTTWQANQYAFHPAPSSLDLLLRVMPAGFTVDAGGQLGRAARGEAQSSEPVWMPGRLDATGETSQSRMQRALDDPQAAPQYLKDTLMIIDGSQTSSIRGLTPPSRTLDDGERQAQETLAQLAMLREWYIEHCAGSTT